MPDSWEIQSKVGAAPTKAKRRKSSEACHLKYGRYTDFGGIHSYDLPAPLRNVLLQPQVWPVSSGQMGELRLGDDSSVHRFCVLTAVVAGASIAGLRGEF